MIEGLNSTSTGQWVVLIILLASMLLAIVFALVFLLRLASRAAKRERAANGVGWVANGEDVLAQTLGDAQAVERHRPRSVRVANTAEQPVARPLTVSDVVQASVLLAMLVAFAMLAIWAST